jgi:hypothetical protein
MTVSGWLFMGTSISAVLILVVTCYVRILSADDGAEDGR